MNELHTMDKDEVMSLFVAYEASNSATMEDAYEHEMLLCAQYDRDVEFQNYEGF